MNINNFTSPLRMLAFRTWRSFSVLVPGGRINAFGGDANQIAAIMLINLDRQPRRLRRVKKELRRFRTAEGLSLTSITQRLTAVDARDGRAVAATVDVDAVYTIGDQLYVQPDPRLASSFAEDEVVRMTRQEVAVARSHIEAWKAIATGSAKYVLVLEDDIWFTPGAAAAIDRCWLAALRRCTVEGDPKLLYLSYADAGGTAMRDNISDIIFRPIRGLWFLSAYVLSREGAAALLRAMPVVGPVDLWMNYRFAELSALAISSPAIAQRQDGGSDNAYSILPYLARAGIVDAGGGAMSPGSPHTAPVLAWTGGMDHESLAMALSMLGLRVRVFDGDEQPLCETELEETLEIFDALVDAPLMPTTVVALATNERLVVVLEANAPIPAGLDLDQLPASRVAILSSGEPWDGSWEALCNILDLDKPVAAFPTGAQRRFRLFRDGRQSRRPTPITRARRSSSFLDNSPWVLPVASGWQPRPTASSVPTRAAGPIVAEFSMTGESSVFRGLAETFPGNMAAFTRQGIQYNALGAHLIIDRDSSGPRPYRSGAVASVRPFTYGRFEAEIRAAQGSGLVTGFFLHRDSPRQEIDIEFVGSEPRRMLINVFFNPGDDGTAMGFGYRGAPWSIDLGFDATTSFHRYSIDWQPDRITWMVDGRVVHERVGWDPTPIPHLPMHLHANLWAPRSEELAGRIDEGELPSAASFRNVVVYE